MAKKKRQTKFTYVPTREDIAAKTLCNDNDCFVEPLPIDSYGNRLRLKVTRPGKKPQVGGDYNGLTSEWVIATFNIYHSLKSKYEKEESKTK